MADQQIDTGLLIQLLRGLDNSMPQAMQPMWQKMTPDFQRQKAMEQQTQMQDQQQLQQGGAEDPLAQDMAEHMQYRRARR